MYVTASSLASKSDKNWSISSAQDVIYWNLISWNFSDNTPANFLEIEFKEFSLNKNSLAVAAVQTLKIHSGQNCDIFSLILY